MLNRCAHQTLLDFVSKIDEKVSKKEKVSAMQGSAQGMLPCLMLNLMLFVMPLQCHCSSYDICEDMSLWVSLLYVQAYAEAP